MRYRLWDSLCAFRSPRDSTFVDSTNKRCDEGAIESSLHRVTKARRQVDLGILSGGAPMALIKDAMVRDPHGAAHMLINNYVCSRVT